MPVIERNPTVTTVIVAGWQDPTNAYAFDNAFAYTETDVSNQEYSGYGVGLSGVEEIDKVLIRLKWKTTVTAVISGDTATTTCTLRVYNGSTWQDYQVTAQDYACSTVNDESFVLSEGDNSNASALVDVTGHVDTLAKLQSIKTQLLSAITETKTITLLLAGYVACVVGDVGKVVTDDTVAVGTLVSYDNVARTWVITTSAVIADGSVMAITAGTGAGTTTGAATGITVRWSVDGVSVITCYHITGGVFVTTQRKLEPKIKKSLQNLQKALQSHI